MSRTPLDKDTVLDDLDEALDYLRQLRRDVVEAREVPRRALYDSIEHGVQLLKRVGRGQ